MIQFPGRLADSRILIVDDEPANVALATAALTDAGLTHLETCLDSRQALNLVESFLPDLVILDLNMPYLSGYQVLDRIRAATLPDPYLPVIVVTADARREAWVDAFNDGATDFLTKPIDILEFLLRVRTHLETRRLHLVVANHNAQLENRVAARTRQLELAQREIAERLARAAEYRDDTTGRHTRRVARLSVRIAEELGLDPDRCDAIELAAPLHDLGKIGIPDAILLKPGPLSVEEFDQVKQHVEIGAELLSGGTSPLLKMAERIALTHHERWDGTGYLGLMGNDIPQESRVVSVADVFDALTHVRPYKRAWSPADAIAEIKTFRGTHFDPDVVDAFLVVCQSEPITTYVSRRDSEAGWRS